MVDRTRRRVSATTPSAGGPERHHGPPGPRPAPFRGLTMTTQLQGFAAEHGNTMGGLSRRQRKCEARRTAGRDGAVKLLLELEGRISELSDRLATLEAQCSPAPRLLH